MSEIILQRINEKLEPLRLSKGEARVATLLDPNDTHKKSIDALHEALITYEEAQANARGNSRQVELESQQTDLRQKLSELDRREVIRNLFVAPDLNNLDFGTAEVDLGALQAIFERAKATGLQLPPSDLDNIDADQIQQEIDNVERELVEIKRLSERSTPQEANELEKQVEERKIYKLRIERVFKVFERRLQELEEKKKKLKLDWQAWNNESKKLAEKNQPRIQEEIDELDAHMKKAQRVVDYYDQITSDNPTLLNTEIQENKKNHNFKIHLRAAYVISKKILMSANRRKEILNSGDIEGNSPFTQRKKQLEFRQNALEQEELKLQAEIEEFFRNTSSLSKEDYRNFEVYLYELINILQNKSEKEDFLELIREEIQKKSKENPGYYETFLKINPELAEFIQAKPFDPSILNLNSNDLVYRFNGRPTANIDLFEFWLNGDAKGFRLQLGFVKGLIRKMGFNCVKKQPNLEVSLNGKVLKLPIAGLIESKSTLISNLKKLKELGGPN